MNCLTRTILLAVCLTGFFAISTLGQASKEMALYKVIIDEKIAFIDRTGKIVIRTQYDDFVGDFSEGLAEFTDQNALPKYPFSKSGYIDTTGKVVIKPQFDVAYDFSNGRALVKNGDLASFIDKTGKQVIKLGPYQAARSFREGLAAVYSNFEFWFIDTQGKIIIPRQTGIPKDFAEGLAWVYLPVEGKLKGGYIDKSANTVIAPQFDECFDFSEGLASVKIGGKVGFVDRSGKLVVSPTYRSAHNFVNGRARVSSGEKIGFIDQGGDLVIDEKFDTGTWDFSEGLAPACENGVCGYIDPSGRYVIGPKFNSVFNFKNGIASVLLTDYRNAYINMRGEIIWKEIR